jgi:hypothetical protein
MGGFALAAPASAADLGTVQVTGTGSFESAVPEDDASSATQGAALDACRQNYPATKSIDMLSWAHSGVWGQVTFQVTWVCRDTP